MRIAVISAPTRRPAPLGASPGVPPGAPPPDYVQALAKGMEMMGHRADIINLWADDGMRLPGYEYIAIVLEPASLFSAQIPDQLPKFLAAGSSLAGKKSAAFIKKKGIRQGKILANLMKAMEKEGMIVNWSDVLFNAPHAEAMGKRIGP